MVAGPTAVGKTDLCINLAKKFNTCIISADSRQFYKEINIGTAKPTQKQLNQVDHYFIDTLSVQDDYDVREFEKETLDLLDVLFKTLSLVIISGGSGLYLDAIAQGFDVIPTVDKSVRDELNQFYQQQGLQALQARLQSLDPIYYEKVDLNNPQRLIRALEVTIGTGKPFSSFRKSRKVERAFDMIKIALHREREELYERIDDRMDQMIAGGLFEEASGLYPLRHLNALQTVGYKEIFGYMNGSYDRDEAIRLLKRNSRRYSKRQMTWFRKDDSYTWFNPSQTQEIMTFIDTQIA